MDYSASRVDVVVIAVNDNDTGICLYAVYIVVKITIFCHDAILNFFGTTGTARTTGIGLLIAQIHFTVCGNVISTFGYDSVGLGNPISLSVLYHLAGTIKHVIVAIDIDQARIILDITIFNQVCAAFEIAEATVFLHPTAIVVEAIPTNSTVGCISLLQASIKVAIHHGKVDVAINGNPTIGFPCTSPAVTIALRILNNLTASQNVICKGIGITSNGLLAINCLATVCRIEIIVLNLSVRRLNCLPTGFQLSKHSVVKTTIHFEQAIDDAIAAAVFQETIVILLGRVLIAGHTMDTGNINIIHIIAQYAIFLHPALTIRAV